MNNIRIGITGSGFMGNTHAEAARLVEETDLAAVFGGRRAPQLAETYGIQLEPSAESLAARNDVDAVIITTPHHLHVDEAMAAIRNGKHVLIEKPITTTLEDADRILDAARKAGVVVSVGYQQRFRRNNVAARQVVESGAIGDVLTIQVAMPIAISAMQADSGFGPSWGWWTDARSIGHVLNSSPHAIDLMRWMMGAEVSQVVAFCRTYKPDSPVEDTTLALLSFSNGAMMSLFSSCAVAPPSFPGEDFRFRIMGSKELLDLDPYGELRVTRDGQWETASTQPSVGHTSSKTILGPVRMQAYCDQIRAFVAAIRGGKPEAGTGEDGRAGVEAFTAMLESSNTGKVIRLR
ncbi:MAG: Gfo/Idh/MocA family protein [Bryobacteraceae bacterium]